MPSGSFFMQYTELWFQEIWKVRSCFLKKVLIYCSSSYFHLWYLPMLAGILAVTPLLWEIVNCERGKKWEEYLILLFLDLQDSAVHDELFLISAERVCYGSDVYDSAWNDSGLCRIFCSGALSFSHYEIPKKMEKTVYILWSRSDHNSNPALSDHVTAGRKRYRHIMKTSRLAGFFWGSAVFLFFKNYVSRIQWTEKQEEVIAG